MVSTHAGAHRGSGIGRTPPRINEELSGNDLLVNIGVLDGDDRALYSIDGIYAFKEIQMDEFLNEIYSRFIEDLKESFPRHSSTTTNPDQTLATAQRKT